MILPPKQPFSVCFHGSPCTELQVRGCVFRLIPHLLEEGRANGVPTLNRLFVRLTVSAVEALKVTQISITERHVNERSPVTQLQDTACIFGSPYAFHFTAEGLTVYPFCGSFFVRLTVLPL